MQKVFKCILIVGMLLSGFPLHGEGWKARWISRSYAPCTGNTWIAFQKKVNLDSVPESLPARIAADSKYWLWINGEMAVYEGGLKRGPAPGDGYYDTVDIAPWLKPGQNVISVLVWYFGRNGFSHMGSGACALLFEASGDGVEILSDSSWDACEHFAYGTASGKAPNYRLSESNVRYDARRFNPSWFMGGPRKMGSAFELAIAPGQAPLGRLLPRPIPMWKDYGLKDYEDVVRRGDTLVCTLPYNAQFSAWMELDAPAGKKVRLLTDHDYVGTEKCVSGEYITRDGAQSYEHLPWMNGEKMYYIVPEGVEIKAVKYRETGYDTAFSGYFRCGDPVLDGYWQKAARTLYVCMRDTWMDCPDRERAQWIGDEVHEQTVAAYSLSPSAALLARKGYLEFASWAAPDGSLYAPVPCSNWFKELPQQSLAAVSRFGMADWWQHFGDSSFIPEVYPAVHRYLHETWQLDADSLPVERRGGWNWADAGKGIDKTALLNIWFYLALDGERTLALRQGKEADAAEDLRIMSGIKDSFNRLYWDGTCYRTPGFSGEADDRVQALAVVSGIAEPDKYDAILKVLDSVRKAESYMMRYVLDAYFIMGQAEKGLERMREYALDVMRDDSSTLWEHRGHNGSGNHAWSGHGIIVLGQRVAGIIPLSPGFREFGVKPQMGSLKHVECCLETAYGMIEVTLDRKGRRIRASVNVPEGTVAVITDARGRLQRLSPGRHSVVL